MSPGATRSARLAYSALLRVIAPAYVARLWWRGRAEPLYREAIGERFGRYAGDSSAGCTILHEHGRGIGLQHGGDHFSRGRSRLSRSRGVTMSSWVWSFIPDMTGKPRAKREKAGAAAGLLGNLSPDGLAATPPPRPAE